MISQNQVQREIKLGVTSIFWMSFPTVAFFFAEIRGHSKLYDNISDSSSGRGYLVGCPDGIPLKHYNCWLFCSGLTEMALKADKFISNLHSRSCLEYQP
jgi:hypothetical protein